MASPEEPTRWRPRRLFFRGSIAAVAAENASMNPGHSAAGTHDAMPALQSISIGFSFPWLTIAITTLLLSYLIILPSVMRLRRTHPDVVRPFRIPGGQIGLYISAGLTFIWVLFGSWEAVFPGVLEHWLGVDYDFYGT